MEELTSALMGLDRHGSWKTNSKEVEEFLETVVGGFVSPFGEIIATQVLRLWEKTQNRELCRDFLNIAFDIDIEWLIASKQESIVEMGLRTHDLHSFLFTDLKLLNEAWGNKLADGLSAMGYKQYLRTNYWKVISKEAKKRASFRCTECKIGSGLQTHHKTYKHKGYEYLHMGDLVVLCAQCHLEEHLSEPER